MYGRFLYSSLFILLTITLPSVYADAIISVSLDLQTILLDEDEIIPLLNTNNIANMSKITISATLPCNSSNVPDLKIIGGVLGNTTSIIDSASDYQNLRGPFDTCYFEDTLDVLNSTLPAINRIFLTNEGSSSVLTNLGTTVTVTGIVSQNTTQTSVTNSSSTLQDDFSVDNWTDESGNTGVSGGVLIFDGDRGTKKGSWRDIGLLSDSSFEIRFKYDLTVNSARGNANYAYLFLSSTDGSQNSATNRDSLGFNISNQAAPLSWTVWSDGGTHNSNSDSMTYSPTTENLYIKLERTSTTSFTVSLYSDSGFETVIETNTVTIPSGISDLRYFVLTSEASGTEGTGTINIELDDLIVYHNGSS